MTSIIYNISAILRPRIEGMRWNLQNVFGPAAQIEFRSPPQSKNAQDTCRWIAFFTDLSRCSISGELGSQKIVTRFAERMLGGAAQLRVVESLGWMVKETLVGTVSVFLATKLSWRVGLIEIQYSKLFFSVIYVMYESGGQK